MNLLKNVGLTEQQSRLLIKWLKNEREATSFLACKDTQQFYDGADDCYSDIIKKISEVSK